MNCKHLLFCLIILQVTTNGLTQSIKRLDGSSITLAALTNKIQAMADSAHVQGLSVTVFNDNKIVYKKAFGFKRIDSMQPLATNTNFYGASLSKAVFSVMVMKLVEQGIISLDKPLESYLPQAVYEYGPGNSWNQDYSSLKGDTVYKSITARMCLSHTTGFANWRWDEPDQKLHIHFTPGAHYSYSGEGLCYLQFIIEKITKKTLPELMQEVVFSPLHMNSSAYTWLPRFEQNYCFGHASNGNIYPKDKDNAPRSASTLETTPDDYSLFLEAVLQNKLLKLSSYKELFKKQIGIYSRHQMGPKTWADSTSENNNIKLGYGLGWGVFESPYGNAAFKEGHGDGFQHYSIVFPKMHMGILIMTNSDNGEKIFKELLAAGIGDIYTPWKWEGYIPYNFQ